MSVEGPILCLPDTWLMWDVKGFEDITPETLALLDLIDPAPEVVIVGCGSRIRQLPPPVTQHLKARGIAVEALDTVSDLGRVTWETERLGALWTKGACEGIE